jgi:hypothetical protein
MIGGVKTGTLEDDPNGCINLPQRFFIAFRATGEWSVIKTLVFLELDATTFTPIGINRHFEPQ